MQKTIGEGSFAKVTVTSVGGGEKIAIKKILDTSNPIYVKRLAVEYNIMKSLSNMPIEVVPRPETYNNTLNEFSMTYYDNNLQNYINNLTTSGANQQHKNHICKQIVNIFLIVEKNTAYVDLFHCDIKPNNFLVSTDPISRLYTKVVISDFGVSTFKGMKDDIVIEYIGVGDSNYILEEVYNGGQPPSKQSEIYSVLRVLNYVYSGGNAQTEFDNDIWGKFNNGKICSFDSLMYELDKYIANPSNDPLSLFSEETTQNDIVLDLIGKLNLKTREGIESFAQSLSESDLLYHRIFNIFNTNKDGHGKEMFDLITNEELFKKIFWFPYYDVIAGLMNKVIMSTRYSVEEKIVAYEAISFIAKIKNSFFAQNLISQINNNEDIRTVLPQVFLLKISNT